MDFARCIFDIETDGLLDDVTKIHCIVVMDVDTGAILSTHTEDELDKALKTLRLANEIIGHNIICFDLPVLNKLYGFEVRPITKITDTLVCTRLIYPDLKNDDFKYKPTALPIKLYGRHSLEAWGLRLGEYKDDFSKTTDWAEWSQEMQTYCEQDVKVTKRLYDMILSKDYSKTALDMEHQFQQIIFRQEQTGYCFNQEKAVSLYAEIAGKRDSLRRQLQEIFPAQEIEEEFIPKRDNKTKGYKTGVAHIKRKSVPFNPASRTQISQRLIEKYGWEPVEYTDKGAPMVSEEVLDGLDYPEAKMLSRFLMLEKRAGQLAEGQQAWLKTVGSDGRIHGVVITNGAVTGRCTHSKPNIAQVPSVGAEYGEACRALFGPPDGYYQLGCDASGLELRCLAHYITKYDGGTYMEEVLNGDIHTANQKAAGLATRNEAKRFIYAFLYGAGDNLIGSLIDPSLTNDSARSKLGKLVKARFLNNMPALNSLIFDVQRTVKNRGWLKGLDGRILPARSQHSALNLLLQSAGAIIMKKATCLMWDAFKSNGFIYGDEVMQLAHIHDEYQLAVRNDLPSELIGNIAVQAIRDSGVFFDFRCPLDGEYKTGKNWAECH